MQTQTDYRVFQVQVATDNWPETFRGWLEARGCGSATIKAYLQDIRAFSAWFEQVNQEPMRPELITGVDLRAWREACLAGGAAPATWNRRRAALAVLCDWALEQGYVNYNPFQGVMMAQQAEQPPRWLDNSEYHRLVRQVEREVNIARTDFERFQSTRDAAIVGLMLWAGLREAEVCALEVGDLDLGERRGRVVVRRGKGDKRREVPLGAELRRALRAWLEAGGRSGGVLFLGKGGESLSERGVQRIVRRLADAAGLDKDVTPHALRHTFAKRMLDSGIPLTVVSKLLGHSRLDTTARYVQPGWDDLERAVNGQKI